jgi:hypothetical protein
LVWSDSEIATLSREFVTVADEAYTLYPEHPEHLKRVQGTPAHEFFKRYGEAMPEGDWNHRGTKQGLYMIGPNGEYLEGKFAASGLPDDILKRMERALERWQKLRHQAGYANTPVPKVVTTLPARVAGKDFVLRVHSRDLPRGEGGQGRRFDPDKDLNANWGDFKKWAWNVNWLAVDRWRVLVPSSKQVEDVDAAFVTQLAREMLIDNVRGQAKTWSADAVKTAKLTMLGMPNYDVMKVMYRGEVELDNGQRSMKLKLLGDAVYDQAKRRFRKLRIVAIGLRAGSQGVSQREDDSQPSPIGFAINLYRPPESVDASGQQRKSGK